MGDTHAYGNTDSEPRHPQAFTFSSLWERLNNDSCDNDKSQLLRYHDARFHFLFVCLQGIADLNMFCKPAVLGALAHFILNAYVAMVGLPLALFASIKTILLNDAFQCSLSTLSVLIYSALPEIVLDRSLVFDSRNPIIMSRMKTHWE